MKLFLLSVLSVSSAMSFAMAKPSISNCSIPNQRHDITNEISKLYTHQSLETINSRLKDTQDSFYFFRSYVPYYYEILSKCKTEYTELNKLFNRKGLVVGDPHPMNFGTVFLNDSGKDIALSLNDPDDGGIGYYAADLVRYLSSIEIMSPETFKENVITSYLEGLNGSSYQYSKKSLKILKKSIGKMKPSSKYVDFDNQKFSKRKSSSYDLDENTIDLLKDIVKHDYDAVLLEAYGLLKYTGGSGGLNRFEVLIKQNSKTYDNKIQWLEFKGIAPHPGNFPMTNFTNATLEQRYESNIILQQGKDALEHFKISSINGDQYLGCFRFSGNKSYDLEKISTKDLKKIVSDQLYTLGKLHAKSLSKDVNSRNYAKQVSTNVKSLLALAKKMAQIMNSSYKYTR